MLEGRGNPFPRGQGVACGRQLAPTLLAVHGEMAIVANTPSAVSKIL
jgi:hypothetical protein